MISLQDLPIPENLVYVIAGVFGLLAFATLLVAVMRRGKADEVHKELWLRVKSWWYMAGIFIFAIAINRTLSVIFLALLSFLAFKEYLSMIPTRRADHRVLFWAYLAIPIQFYWIHAGWYGMFIIFIPVWVFLFLPFRMVLLGETEGFLRAIGTLSWGLMMTVFALSHAAYLLVLPESALVELAPATAVRQFDKSGAGLLFLLVLLTQFNDVAQYVWGKLIGGPKIIPKVSPGKTWAGFLGGMFSTSLLALALGPLLSPMSLMMAGIAGAVTALAGFIGDVTISAIKRDLGVKDTGSTIPGHGGLLDRLDSLTYSAPIFFHYIRYFYY
ncbi:phosphatidate cytidylyltransferase [Kiloniella laminariae]|uniref:Phosphatidate cytidylyltransferase n=1 Tax=Kiloniella laminariae TaxID=454162 RepID=A0ABT4LDH8_9PROT|nr:phosphatidate cytidylyltransferase [Kiloniella laminariae]MCZ4279156.1 phosphatidate cytidylyltransferase [Kiloniella laminariae]